MYLKLGALHEMSQLASIQIYFEPQDPRTCPSVPVPVFQSQCSSPSVPGSLPSLKLPIDIETLHKICWHGNFAFHFQIPKYIVNLTDILICEPLISTMEFPHIIFLVFMPSIEFSTPSSGWEYKANFLPSLKVKSEEFAWEEAKLVTPSWWKEGCKPLSNFWPFFSCAMITMAYQPV